MRLFIGKVSLNYLDHKLLNIRAAKRSNVVVKRGSV